VVDGVVSFQHGYIADAAILENCLKILDAKAASHYLLAVLSFPVGQVAPKRAALAIE